MPWNALVNTRGPSDASPLGAGPRAWRSSGWRLRSPFLPGYGIFQGAWVATILLAVSWSDRRARWIVPALWASLIWTTAGPPALPPSLIATITTLQMVARLVLFALAVGAGRRAAPDAS